MVFDVTKRESFDFLSSWLDELRADIGDQSDMDRIVIAVCANKVDKTSNRIVNESEGRLWAESNGFLYFETSALSGEGIQEMFQVGISFFAKFDVSLFCSFFFFRLISLRLPFSIYIFTCFQTEYLLYAY